MNDLLVDETLCKRALLISGHATPRCCIPATEAILYGSNTRIKVVPGCIVILYKSFAYGYPSIRWYVHPSVRPSVGMSICVIVMVK